MTSRGPTYGSYLRLDKILDAQEPLSAAHDELLFIVIHQSSELWLKLCLHELDPAREALREDRVQPALKMLTRVVRTFELLVQSWTVLGTITPADYSAMRASLGTSSGFQSHQYRLFEFLLGAKNEGLIAVHDEEPALRDSLRAALAEPSLYDEAIALLARRGIEVPADALARDWTQPRPASPGVERAWTAVYQDVERHWDLYELAEKLVDLESRVQTWRFGHLQAVERIIGSKRGTGGTSGVGYLAAVIERPFFPELAAVRALL